MRRLALALTPMFLVACRDDPTAPNLARLTAPQAAGASVAARASSTEFDGFVNTCSSTDPTDVKITPRGILHFKASNENKWITGNSLIDGIEHNTVKAKINQNTGQGVVHLDSSLKPDAVNGTWEMEWRISLPDFVGSGVGHGTGHLKGMKIKFTFDLAAGPSDCNPNAPKGHVHGVILSPASSHDR
jgi:hypothetical protein